MRLWRLPLWLTRNCLGPRSFYLALYKQMSFLEKRGCPRTALEFCKLILRWVPASGARELAAWARGCPRRPTLPLVSLRLPPPLPGPPPEAWSRTRTLCACCCSSTTWPCERATTTT